MSEQVELQMEVAPMARPTFTPSMRFVCGISGGKDGEAAALHLLHESGVPKDQIVVVFCDTGNEHELTYAQVKLFSETVHPVTYLMPEMDFFSLAFNRHRFPSAMARFCTEALKIEPSQDFILSLRYRGFEPISVSGVRADESEERKNLPEWDYSGTLLCIQWRPLIRWRFADVVAIHERHSLPLNPLYALGAERVGCYPCIMSRKDEIRRIALTEPARIDNIRRWEAKFSTEYGRYSSFFAFDKVPERFRSMPFVREDGTKMMVATIDDVVRWSMTGDRAQGNWADPSEKKEPTSCRSGFCE